MWVGGQTLAVGDFVRELGVQERLELRQLADLLEVQHVLGADNVEYIWKLDEKVQGQAKTYAQHMLDLKQIRQLPKFETFLNPKFSNEIASS